MALVHPHVLPSIESADEIRAFDQTFRIIIGVS